MLLCTNLFIFILKILVINQGSFFRLQNTKELTLVGLFMEGTTLICLETYSDAKKKNLVINLICFCK
jgi:hypothetical protein